jgi:hypothetical protein
MADNQLQTIEMLRTVVGSNLAYQYGDVVDTCWSGQIYQTLTETARMWIANGIAAVYHGDTDMPMVKVINGEAVLVEEESNGE